MFRLLTSPPRFAVAVIAVVVAVAMSAVIRVVLQPAWPGQISSPLLLVAVALSAWYGGNGPGLLSATLSLWSLEFLFLPPTYSVSVDWADVPRLFTFFGASLLIARLSVQRRLSEAALIRLEEQLRAARTIQERLLPEAAPKLAGVDIAGVSFPANSVGGDYFDFIPLPGGVMGVVVADVSGHGLGPALLMAETRAYLRSLATIHEDVSQILTLTNRVLTDDTEGEFVTLFFAALDPRRRTFIYAGAGHEAYLFEPAGQMQQLSSTSLPLGIERDLVVPCGPTIRLATGQVYLLLTDGVAETESREGVPFGNERVFDIVKEHRAGPAQGIIESLRGELERFSSQQPQVDDITIVAIKIEAMDAD